MSIAPHEFEYPPMESTMPLDIIRERARMLGESMRIEQERYMWATLAGLKGIHQTINPVGPPLLPEQWKRRAAAAFGELRWRACHAWHALRGGECYGADEF